jgi:4-hydroxy-3-methylbut-2-en-1-yl diphosphate reductase
MMRLLICTALRIEARAVRYGGVDATRVGMGPKRARRAAGRLPHYQALAVAGFGGAVQSDLRPGDVVVASEVRDGDRTIPCPWAPSISAHLRATVGGPHSPRSSVAPGRDAATVVSGPMATLARIASRRDLIRLAAQGVTVVDMESFSLVEAAAGRPFAAVRVIVDTPDHPLLRPSTVRAGFAARRRLRQVGPALRDWAATLETV